MKANLCELPNGMVIVDQCRAETEQFYHDIFEKRIYLKNGISVSTEDVVFDVGANIGLFTMFIHSLAPGARVFAFEPAAPLFSLLQANVSRCFANAQLFAYGLGARSACVPFTFYPNSSGMSSFYPDDGEERAVLTTVIRNELESRRSQPVNDILLGNIEDLVRHRLQSFVCQCRIETLSGVLRETGVDRIDLLKVDAQKSEVDVLTGLDEADWPKIRQVVMEVHNAGGRLDAVCCLLRQHNYEVLIEQDELYRASHHVIVYASVPSNRQKLPETEQEDKLTAVSQRALRAVNSYRVDSPRSRAKT